MRHCRMFIFKHIMFILLEYTWKKLWIYLDLSKDIIFLGFSCNCCLISLFNCPVFNYNIKKVCILNISQYLKAFT